MQFRTTRTSSLVLFFSLFALLILSGCNGKVLVPVTASTQIPVVKSERTAVPVKLKPSNTAAASATQTYPADTLTLSPTETAILSQTPTPTQTSTPTETITPKPTATPTKTPRPTKTATPTVTLTPTFAFPKVKVLMQANCRYGPGTAYLYSWGLYEGDRGVVHGRNYNGTWLWIKPNNLDRHCWVSASVVKVTGDIFTVAYVQIRLPHSTLYGPPGNVQAERSGDQVTVTWDRVWMTEDDDRGYLIEASVCQNGLRVPIAVHTDDTSYVFADEGGCAGSSSGLLYTVEKHGYTDPVTIPWP